MKTASVVALIALFCLATQASANTLKKSVYCDSPASYSEMVKIGSRSPVDEDAVKALMVTDACMLNESLAPVKIVKKGKNMVTFKFKSGDTKTTFYTAPGLVD